MNDGHLQVAYHGCDISVRDGRIHTPPLDAHGSEYFQAVRGAFRQGAEIAPNSGFHRDSHVQIALRDLGYVKGWFLPPGSVQLSDADRVQAEARLATVRAAHPKQRRRA